MIMVKINISIKTNLFKPIFLLLIALYMVFTSSATPVLAAPGVPLSANDIGALDSWPNWVANQCSNMGNTSTNAGGSIAPGPIYIMGDSITNLAASAYANKFTGSWQPTVHGLGSRHISQSPPSPGGLAQLDADKATIGTAKAIVIALGTNDTGYSQTSITADVKAAMDKVKVYNTQKAPIFWVNVLDTRSDAHTKTANQAIKDGVGSDGTVIDWYSEAKSKANLPSFQGGVHPTKPADINLLVDLVYKGVTSPSAGSASAGVSLDQQAAQKIAQQAGSGTNVGYALYDSTGKLLANYNDTFENYGASITKSMILVAYLNQVGSGTLSNSAKANVTAMIEQSDNAAADNTYHLLNNPVAQINKVAHDAGMQGFKIDASDPVYVLGQSKITAGDFAKFFAKIDTMIPSSQKSFAQELLSHITPHVGLLEAGLPGTVYSKEGWKQENAGSVGAPWVVNQVGQFSSGGTTYGIAVTVSGTSDEASGESTVKQVVSALIKPGGPAAPTGQATSCCSSSGAGNTPTGTLPSIIPEPYNGAFTAGANKYKVAPALIAAIFTEENFTHTPPSQLAKTWADFPKRHPDPNSGWPTNQFQTQGAFQFIPDTWKSYGKGGNPQNIVDGAAGAANYLASGGATVNKPPSSWNNAIFAYNHAQWYVDAVIAYYNFYNGGSNVTTVTTTPASAPAAPAAGCGANAGSVSCNGATPANTQGLSSTRQQIVCIAQQELALWKSQPGYPNPAYAKKGYLKYSQNRAEQWCADFASWVYDQAKYPLQPDPNWNIAYVPNIQIVGEHNKNFHWHPAGSNYTPKPGDLAIHGAGHVNIFISSSGNAIQYIGGDQGSGPYPGGSIVSTEAGNGYYSNGVTGYVSPD